MDKKMSSTKVNEAMRVIDQYKQVVGRVEKVLPLRFRADSGVVYLASSVSLDTDGQGIYVELKRDSSTGGLPRMNFK